MISTPYKPVLNLGVSGGFSLDSLKYKCLEEVKFY